MKRILRDDSYKKAFLIDMDGVINKGNTLIPGAKQFVDRLKKSRFPYLFITNNSYYTQRELKDRLHGMGIDVKESHFYTSAMATATFIEYQKPHSTAYVIGGSGLIEELERHKIRITRDRPDYVIVGETDEYDYARIAEATLLVQEGARFIATNPDITGPTPRGLVPACGALVAPIERATGLRAYFIGKPNPAMMYWARKHIKVHSANCFMIGDRMDTDIVGGLEAGMTCCLVLTGVTTRKGAERFPYRPDYIFNNIGEIDPRKMLSRRERVKL